MFKVNSKKAVRRIADKSFLANRTRNVIAVAAIALTSVLFTALFTIGIGIVENMQKQTMRQAGGDGMGVLKYITDEEYERIKEHELIEEISYNRILCDSVENEELLKRHGEFYYMDDTAIRLGFCEPTGGHKPEAENEIMMDTKAIQLLGLEQKVGAPVTLELIVHGKAVSRDFVLSGWWEADPVFNVSILIGSRAYVDAHIDELYKSYGKDNTELTGVINSYIMFRNSWGLEGKMERVITESGFSQDENADNYVQSNVNWSYLSVGMGAEPGTIAGIASALILIILTGYLIIYNIFQISVVKDIRFYGLLKTIGTTGRQVKKVIRRQAALLACIGIPIGLCGGYLIGCGLVPVIMDSMAFEGKAFMTETSANPLIFAGSAVFSWITVMISTAKPGRIAARVSPVEAVRYTEGSGKAPGRAAKGKRIRFLLFRSKTASMAAANLGRDKKRTVLAVLSMALSLVLFHGVYTFSIGFDMDKFLSKFIRSDFLVAHAVYFNYGYSGIDTSLSEEMIEAIEEQPGFEEGGKIYANIRDGEFFTTVPVKGEKDEKFHLNLLDNQTTACPVYGMDDFPLKQLEVLEGEIDMEKLKTGKYILEGIICDDHGEPYWETSHYDIGDKVVLYNYKGTADVRGQNELTEYEFEIMAKVKVGYYTSSCGVAYNYNYYLPADVYKQMVMRPGIMNYTCNVSPEGMEEMEGFLENYTKNQEQVISYTSRNKRAAEFEGMRNMVLLIGGTLSCIIGLIGVLNFINSMLTSIITRRREFAVLQSIGMTTGQLKRMLVSEGLMYAASAGITALLLGTALSLAAVRRILSQLWFFTYHFTLLPLVAIIPILIILGMLIPGIMLKSVEKQSIVERIRE